jgi:hypothetical protein
VGSRIRGLRGVSRPGRRGGEFGFFFFFVLAVWLEEEVRKRELTGFRWAAAIFEIEEGKVRSFTKDWDQKVVRYPPVRSYHVLDIETSYLTPLF